MQEQSHIPSQLSRLLPDSATISPEGVLHIANHSLLELAREYGTPLYVFDRATIVNACQNYLRAFREQYHASAVRILYASKAYLSPAVAAGAGVGRGFGRRIAGSAAGGRADGARLVSWQQ